MLNLSLRSAVLVFLLIGASGVSGLGNSSNVNSTLVTPSTYMSDEVSIMTTEMQTVSSESSETMFVSTAEFPTITETTEFMPTSTSQPESTISPKSHTASSVQPTSSVHPSEVVIIKCGVECKALKRRLWAAGVFAVLFGFTTLIFIFLLFRQCRISKDYNDPALSRLI